MQTNQDNQVAKTILSQLGGNMFCGMIGVKRLGFLADALIVHIPTGTTKNKANRLKITLTPADEYNVLFYRAYANKNTAVSTHEGVHAPELIPLFEAETGLFTSLTMRYG